MEKFAQILTQWQIKYLQRADNLETMINTYKKVITGK